MEQNPYQSPHGAYLRPRRRPKQDWIDRLVLSMPRSGHITLLVALVAVIAYLFIPAIRQAREHQAIKNKYKIDPATGYVVPKQQSRLESGGGSLASLHICPPRVHVRLRRCDMVLHAVSGERGSQPSYSVRGNVHRRISLFVRAR